MMLRVITPITTKGFMCADDFAEIVRPDTVLSHVELDHGPASIESEFDEMLATPETVAKIVEAERDGMDAVIINCMGDPGMLAGREAVSIPVIGPCEATMHVASMLGHTFSVITVLEAAAPPVREPGRRLRAARQARLGARGRDSRPRTGERSRPLGASPGRRGELAIEEDGAHVMLFGCTGMLGAAEAVERELATRGYEHVPVIDSMVWAIKLAEAIVDMGLRHSKLSWPFPPREGDRG